MKNELLTKGIILPSGEIGKNKINLVAGRLWRSHARTDSRRNEIATRTAAFLTLSLGEQERRYFYALMLRSRGKKSLDLSGLQNAKQRKQGKDTLPLKIRVLLRNKSKAKE